MIVPTGLLDKWRQQASQRATVKIEMLIELRDLITEMNGDNTIAQVYTEAAEAMRYSASHLRHLIADLREYKDADLRHWISTGVSFDAIRTINALESFQMLNTTPAALFEEAEKLGNATGGTMTTDELVAHATSHNPYASQEYRMNRWIYSGMAKLAIDGGRRDEFLAELKLLVGRYT